MRHTRSISTARWGASNGASAPTSCSCARAASSTSSGWAFPPSVPWSRTAAWSSATDAARAERSRLAAALVVEDLVKTYPGRRKAPPVEAVRGISFTVERGGFFGLLGPNGAGKSTTLGCITTLVRPTSGRVLVDGVDVVAHPAEAKRRIAVVPQTRNLDR